jgi:hypothetical protein
VWIAGNGREGVAPASTVVCGNGRCGGCGEGGSGAEGGGWLVKLWGSGCTKGVASRWLGVAVEATRLAAW